MCQAMFEAKRRFVAGDAVTSLDEILHRPRRQRPADGLIGCITNGQHQASRNNGDDQESDHLDRFETTEGAPAADQELAVSVEVHKVLSGVRELYAGVRHPRNRTKVVVRFAEVVYGVVAHLDACREILQRIDEVACPGVAEGATLV